MKIFTICILIAKSREQGRIIPIPNYNQDTSGWNASLECFNAFISDSGERN